MRFNRLKWLIPLLLTIGLAACDCEKPTKPVSPDIGLEELVGVWQSKYSGRVDTITITEEGTVRQQFEDSRKDYSYDSGEGKLEIIYGKTMHIVIPNGRIYIVGYRWAEAGGYIPCDPSAGYCPEEPSPFPYFDPYTFERVDMIGELRLVVRDTKQGLVLSQFSQTIDAGEGCRLSNRIYFFRQEEP